MEYKLNQKVSCKVSDTYLGAKKSIGHRQLLKLRVPNSFHMKIMKAFDKKLGDTEYYKYRVNLPKKIVEDSNLLGKEVKVRLEKGKIIIEKE